MGWLIVCVVCSLGLFYSKNGLNLYLIMSNWLTIQKYTTTVEWGFESRFDSCDLEQIASFEKLGRYMCILLYFGKAPMWAIPMLKGANPLLSPRSKWQGAVGDVRLTISFKNIINKIWIIKKVLDKVPFYWQDSSYFNPISDLFAFIRRVLVKKMYF